MRTPRIKVAPDRADAFYHVMSRTVNGEMLFEELEKEALRKELWRVADYCGVNVLTYAAMGNHFHVLVGVPKKSPVADDELVRRFGLLHPDRSGAGYSRLEAIRQMLAVNGPEAENWRMRQVAMMGDVSSFMQVFKQRFSIWYNRTHERFGPLWAERFKSVLVEGKGSALRTLAAYIDLNAVRAGIVVDPKEYRFCGYSEAVAGGGQARAGLEMLGEAQGWPDVQAQYRQLLYLTASRQRSEGAILSTDSLSAVLAVGGRLSIAEVLRCRLRFLTRGAILGSQDFVEEHLHAYRLRTGRGKRLKPNGLPPVTDWEGMMAMRVSVDGGIAHLP